MRKKHLILPLAVSAACLLVISAPVFGAADSFTVEDAKKLAASYLPSGSTFIRSETDSREYELKYYNETSQELYELEVSRVTKEVTKLDSQKLDHRGATEVTLTTAEIEKLVKKQYPSAANLSVWLDEDDGYYIYEAALTADGCRIELELHPKTGEILERDMDYTYVEPDSAAQSASSLIGYEKAKALALEQVPDAIITDIELEKESGTLVYEIELYKDGYEYDLLLNAQTGAKIYLSSHRDLWDDADSYHWDHHSTSYSAAGRHHSSHHKTSASSAAPAISIEQAKQILLEKVPGATIKELELDTDDGRLIYEGELRKGQTEYEFEMDADTGRFLEWEEDYDD